MDKQQLSEIDICEKFISPAIARAGWNIHDQIYREYPRLQILKLMHGQLAGVLANA